MILAWQLSRGLVWLKRLAIAAESLADSQRSLLAIERERTPARTKPLPTEIAVADPREWDYNYRIAHPELYADPDETTT